MTHDDDRIVAERRYSPLYFLASLGAGGLSVTFFMYLMFWVPHAGRPVPVFEDIMAYLSTATSLGMVSVVVAMAGIAALTVLHFKTLIWNLRQMPAFRKTEAHDAMLRTNAETQLMAIPLTLAMSVNASFIVGLVFVPGLWGVVEYLFPLALIAFAAIGVYAFALLSRFLGRVLGQGGFDMTANNSFAQLMPTFAIAMVAVGAAAPSAMSHTPWIVGLSLALSTFLMVVAVIIGVVAIVLAVSAMVQHGTAPEAAPTLMVIVPIMTVLGIALLRQDHGLHTTFNGHNTHAATFMLLTKLLSVQVMFGLLGLLVLRRQGYAAKFLSADGQRSAGSYALICPGVAGSVMIHFWVNKGLVATGLIAKFGVAYWVFTLPAIALQFGMIFLLWKLSRLHFARPRNAATAVPAE
jgi:hypothetical protein